MKISVLIENIRKKTISASAAIDYLDRDYGYDNFWDAERSVYRIDDTVRISVSGNDIDIGTVEHIVIRSTGTHLVIDSEQHDSRLSDIRVPSDAQISGDLQYVDILKMVETVADFTGMIPLEIDHYADKIIAMVFYPE